jgi:flavin reductase (DIM6/NTAB) family NADH-FMN oxidoreductase RutF
MSVWPVESGGNSKPHDRIRLTVLSRIARSLCSVDPANFRSACARFATGITVATVTGNDGRPFGFTANSFTSVSCCPPLILICIDHRSSALPHFRNNPMFAINILDSTQRDLSVRFSQRHGDRFEGIEWTMSDSGIPLLDGVLAQLECSTTQTIEAGDHMVLIAEVFGAVWREGDPLVFYGSSYRQVTDQNGRVK